VEERDLRPDAVVHTHTAAPHRYVVGDLDQLVVNTVRTLAIDAVEAAGSGHPGTPMALAPVGYVLWSRFLRYDPSDPGWPDRDRFVLSAGHASMLLYAMVHLSGYDLPLEELKRFRQWGSRCPGHPERGMTPGVEVTTGPLGQGFANAVGLAIAERMLAARFNRPGDEVVDHHTYVICSDGDLMEGVSAEAASLAGNLHLGKLVVLYTTTTSLSRAPPSWRSASRSASASPPTAGRCSRWPTPTISTRWLVRSRRPARSATIHRWSSSAR